MTKSHRITEIDYINFLVAANCDVSCVKAAECYSDNGIVVAHDKINRVSHKTVINPRDVGGRGCTAHRKSSGWLILDDTVIDKIHSERIELTYYQWSGNHHKVVKGIGLITLVWTDGTNTFPVDYRIYDKDGDEMSKNDHFREMLKTASVREFQPYFVMFDSWYSGIDNLKCIAKRGWNWFSRVKKNRMVNPDDTENCPVSSLVIPDDGCVVHMKKYGFIRLFHSINKSGRDRYWATNFLTIDHQDRKNLQAICWAIENYHRALKELCCVEDCKIRKEAGLRNHINCSLRAFIRLEAVNRLNNITIYQAKWEIVKPSISDYLAHPKYAL